MLSISSSILLLGTVLTTLSVATGITSLRGGNFEELKSQAITPDLDANIQGKTWADLGIDPSRQIKPLPRKKRGRKLQSSNYQFASVLSEYGPEPTNLGETAGLNGWILDLANFDGSSEVTADDVTGALKGSCSVVGSNKDHFCTLEILVVDESGESFGSVIASGVIKYEEGEGGYLMIEAAGDEYQEYNGGVVSLTFQSIGDVITLVCELALS